MREQKEIIHEGRNDKTNSHLDDRMVNASPFLRARVKEGGYGTNSSDFWLWRPPEKGFHAIVLTLGGKGLITLDDGTKIKEEKGDAFISWSSGQGHREDNREEEWKMLWITFYSDSPEIIKRSDDYETISNCDFSKLEYLYISIMKEAAYQDNLSLDALVHYEELFLIELKRVLGLSEDIRIQKKREELAPVWAEVAKTLDKSWGIDELVDFSGYSHSHLTRLSLELYGIPPVKKVREIKMRAASIMLMNSDTSIEQIAESVGYSCISTFSVAFKEFYNLSPLKYRNSKRE